MSQNRIKGIHQCCPSGAQFGKPLPGYLFNQFFPARKQFHQDASAVVAASDSTHISARLQPVEQFHRTVMLQHQPLRQNLNRRIGTLWEAPNRKQ